MTNQLEPKLEFDLDGDNPLLKYDDSAPRPSNTIHIGQRKLFLSELRFLTDKVGRTGRTIVIYVGAASGQHLALIRDLFPKVTFLLFDGAPFRIQGPTVRAEFGRLNEYLSTDRPGLYLFNELFFDHHARVIETSLRKYLIEGDTVLLISDIRTADSGADNPLDHNVLADLALQYRWTQILNIDWALLKFRYLFHTDSEEELRDRVADIVLLEELDIDFIGNYGRKEMVYLDGEIWPQAFPGQTSSEVRLMTDGKRLKNYGSNTRYEDTLFGYNMLIRPIEHVNEFADVNLGLDHCGDCSIEAWTWRHYFETIGVPERDMRRTILENVRILSNITRSLLEGGHGYLGLSRSARRTQQVREFYDRDRRQTRGQRRRSRVYELRALNNFLKSALINRYVGEGSTVIDLGGGRGGDLRKFQFPRASRVVLTDISPTSLDEAERRYSDLYRTIPNMFELDLVESDSSDPGLIELLPTADVINSQFHLHYVFDTEERAATTIKTISDTLRPGGYVILTIPNAEYIQGRLVDGRMGNDLYSIERDQSENGYRFYLEDSVDNVTEYFIPRELIVRLAEENGLELIYEKTFNEFIQRELTDDEKNLMNRMVQNLYSDSKFIPIPRDQWEVFRLYKIMIFQKPFESGSDIQSLWNDRHGRRQLETFLLRSSVIRSQPEVYERVVSILNDVTSDVEGYTELREYLDSMGTDVFGEFSLEKWNEDADIRIMNMVSLTSEQIHPTNILDIGSVDESNATALGRYYGVSNENIYAMDIGRSPVFDIAGEDITFDPLEPGKPLPFRDDSISLATADKILHHLEDPMQLIRELYRVLEPGGYMIVTEYDWLGTDEHARFLEVVHGLLMTVLSDPAEMTPEEFMTEHFSQYRSMSEWKSMIESVGFKMVDETTPRPLDRDLRRHWVSFKKPLN